jgi:exodeoxyribonuclease VII large subunit
MLILMAITLKELNEILKEKLPKNNYHVRGEVSRPKLYPSGLYFTLKDDNITMSCKMWKNKLTDEIINISNGDNIEIKAQFDLYKGDLSLTANWAKKLNNIGDLHATFEIMKDEFKKQGYFDKKISLPNCIKKIALITSMKGAAVHDFEYAINNAKCLIDIVRIDAQVQGSECPKQIIDNLNNNNFSDCDLIVITRGGGSMEDLWGFNDKQLVETIYKRNKPVLSAIGHMIDTTLLDYVADISAPTPSLAAQYIIDYNKKYIDSINSHKQNLYNNLINIINKDLTKLEKINNKTINYYNEIKNNNRIKLDKYKNTILFEIKNNLIKLDSISNKYNNKIELYQDNNIINYSAFENIIKNNQPFTLVWNNIAININNYESTL